MRVFYNFTTIATLVAMMFMPSETQAQAHDHPNGVQSMMPAGCPMSLEDVEIEITEIADAVAVTFQTESEKLGTLRERVRQAAAMLQRMAEMMAAGHATGLGSGAEAGEHAEIEAMHGMMAGMNMMRWPSIASVTTEDIETGIQLRLVPKEAAELSDLGQQVRNMAAHVESGECMMMEMMGHIHGPINAQEAAETGHDEHDAH